MEVPDKEETYIIESRLNERSDADFRNNMSIENVSFHNSIQFEKLDDILVENIIQQVEYLFSDANILKDKFLLKHVRRNKEGYVSLKLISSLRKVKALSKDWRIVAYSLQKSKKLQMNEERTKIKRIDPLPEPVASDSSGTVLLFHNIPGYWMYANVNKLLNKLGAIKRIVKINSEADEMDLNVRKTLELYDEFVTYPFAVVTFETPTEAAYAVLQTSHSTSLITLIPLVDDENLAFNGVPISPPKDKNVEFEPKDSTCNFNDKISSIDFWQLEKYKLKFLLNKSNSASPKNIVANQEEKCNKQTRFKPMGKETFLQNKEKPVLPCTYRGDGPENKRWVQRKCISGYHKGPRVIVLRQPKGPDDTKGFQACRINASKSVVF